MQTPLNELGRDYTALVLFGAAILLAPLLIHILCRFLG